MGSMKAEKERKRILMLAPTPFFSDRGCHIRILNSYLRLKKEGNEITLITYPLGRNVLDIKPLRTINLPGYKKTSPGFSPYKPFLDFLLLIKTKIQLIKGDYDYIYAHLYEGALAGILLRPFFRKKVIFDSQDSLTEDLISHKTIKRNSYLYKLLLKAEKFIANHSDSIIVSSSNLKEFMINELGVKKEIKVIPDFPDSSLFNSKVKPVKLPLPKNKIIVVYLGGLQIYKGIDHLLNAIPYTEKKFHFLIMGYPVEEAKELAKKLKIEDRITLTGKILYEEAPSYLKLGDLAVSPKTMESGETNGKLYNYKAMNLRVVCWDTKENRAIMGKQGIYAKEGNIEDFARKINSFGKHGK